MIILVNDAQGSASFASNKETRSILIQMFPNVLNEKLDTVLSSATNWEDAVDMLSEKEPKSGAEIQSFIESNLISSKQKLIKIVRDQIWREALTFYKLANVNKMTLFHKLRVRFKDEMGIDVGAMSGIFYKIF